MANSGYTLEQTLTDRMTESLRNVVTELYREVSARFATKQEADIIYASVDTCESIVDELT